ncbi:MAG: FAD-dependent oxidoreductase [Chloroflexaceae bacterium]|nr:FAD-dependent oxidoreductase [Chloroflexaceae bacterium]
MQHITTDVLVIGGGATGLGAVRDLAMRGIRAMLVEKGDLTHGTTGRYHGLLHSGGRYVISDPQSARECAHENVVLRRIMPSYIEDTGGLFVTTPWDDADYGEQFVAACQETGVAVEELAVDAALRREPALNPKISRAFEVADAAADSFFAAYGIAHAARQYGATVLNYHYVVDMVRKGERVVAAIVEDLRSGEIKRIEAGYILNAAGAWAGKIAALAGVSVTVRPGKGTMIAMNHRMVNTVINRCKYPHDGDIVVPIHTVAVIGTTDVHVADPDVFGVTADEVTFLLEEGEKLIPGFRRYRALRAWAGVRPLYKDREVSSDRAISRAFKLLRHDERDGVGGMLSIVGGKWTTYRLMAEQAVDVIAQELGVTRPCRTHEEVIPGNEEGKHFWLGHNLSCVETEGSYGELICECELITREQVIDAIVAGGAANIDDIRRSTRLGMGPCQGGFCAYRAAALWDEIRHTQPAGSGARTILDQAPAVPVGVALLHHFLQARWKGLRPIMWGEQVRQASLDHLIYHDLLGIDLLPAELTHRPDRASRLVTEHPAIATEEHAV